MEDCNHQPRKARACSKIEPQAGCFTWNMQQKLRAVRYVTAPYLVQRGTGYKVLSLVLLAKKTDELLQPLHREGIALRQIGQPGARLRLVLDHAARRRA